MYKPWQIYLDIWWRFNLDYMKWPKAEQLKAEVDLTPGNSSIFVNFLKWQCVSATNSVTLMLLASHRWLDKCSLTWPRVNFSSSILQRCKPLERLSRRSTGTFCPCAYSAATLTALGRNCRCGRICTLFERSGHQIWRRHSVAWKAV